MINYNLYERKQTEDGYDYYTPYDIDKITICGKSIDEIITILNALDLERITQIKVTMENLAQFKKLLEKELMESAARSFRNSVNTLLEKVD